MKKSLITACLLSALLLACNDNRDFIYQNEEFTVTCGSQTNPVQSVIFENGAVCTARTCLFNGASCTEIDLNRCDDMRALNVFRFSLCPSDEYTCTTDIDGNTACAASCASNRTMCHAACIDTQSDKQNCGTCDNACPEDALCLDGECTTACPQNQTLCGNECLNLNALHISSCTPDGSLSCKDGFADCDQILSNGCETDLNTNAHCGKCDTTCGPLESCAQGTCASGCLASDGYAQCGEKCIQLALYHYAQCNTCFENWCDLDNDPDNGCEADAHSLHLNTTCSQCLDGYCDLDNDLTNGCENTAENLHYEACGTCKIGFADCDNDPANGCEINLSTDNDHCGACGNICGNNKTCIDGECTPQCTDGLAFCDEQCIQLSSLHYAKCDTCLEYWCDLDGNAENGCETDAHALHLNADCSACADDFCDIDNDLTNGCENTAGNLHYNTCGTCQDGFTNCDLDPANGCEIDISNDHENCGACNNACKSNEYCVEGSCISQCKSDQGNAFCDNTCVHLAAKNLASCDTCLNNWCDLDGDKASTGCEVHAPDIHMSSTCDSCEAGWCNIDHSIANGCETSTSLVHLDNDCSTCAYGFCDLDDDSSNGCEANMSIWHLHTCDSCEEGWCDADNNLANGCEANILISADNCGACGNKCPDRYICQNGSCILKCALGETKCSEATCFDFTKQHWLDCDGTCENNFTDCDNKISNGCETDTTTHDNCGACGNNCGDAECVDGICTCPSGLSLCNGKCVNLKTDKKNCGECGFDVSTVPPHATASSCQNGKYVIICETKPFDPFSDRYEDCDGVFSNGCEANLYSNNNHCGSCSNSCSSAYSFGMCRMGKCEYH